MAEEFAISDTALGFVASLFSTHLATGSPPDIGITIGLFINDYIPIPGITSGDVTEPGVAGYARQYVGAGAWTQGVIAHVQILTAPSSVTFTTTDPTGELCYGYFAFQRDQDELYWAQLFATPQLLVSGVPISFTPRWKEKNCPDV